MSVRLGLRRVVLTSGVVSMCVTSNGCGLNALDLDVSDTRGITAVVLADFMRRYPPDEFPIVFVSDEHVDFPIDSAFIRSLSHSTTPVRAGRRADVWVSYDIVRDGGLLLEPASPELIGGLVLQNLRFSSTASFGGELQYRLRRVRGTWSISEMRIIWII